MQGERKPLEAYIFPNEIVVFERFPWRGGREFEN
jgi:hypothetical protein